ncbi:MAG: hypothetical protein NVS3B1_21900 [Marmoricola sp.]
MRYGFGYHHPHHWMGMGLVMPLVWLIFLAAFVWIFVRLARQGVFAAPHPMGAAGSTRETPEEVLDRRFASGEIDAEAHAAALQHLRDHRR